MRVGRRQAKPKSIRLRFLCLFYIPNLNEEKNENEGIESNSNDFCF